jgi:hypothetical protein
MDKTESIVRRILGWKLNSLDKWYDHENSIFIDKNEFQPYENIEHAMQIVKRLEAFGYQYTNKDDVEVSFDNKYNHASATGNTLAEAISNAAYQLADSFSPADEWL